MATISQRELRNDSGAVMRRVDAGETFVVTRNGVPVADLVPHRPAPAAFVPVAAVIDALSDLPPWDTVAFGAERDELAAIVDDADRDAWSTP